MKSLFRTALAVALVSFIGVSRPASAATVEVGILKPVTKIVGKEVVTTLKIKNISKVSINGFKVEEYWYDKAGNAAPGDSRQLRQPLGVGAVITIELKTPRTPNMDRNSYQFTHAGGAVTATVLPKIE